MLERLIERRHQGNEEGFTLIELMVVVLIIAILIAIAIPTFLGARERAQNRSAQSNVRNALTAEKTSYTDTQTYTATSATLTAIEPSLTYVNAVPAKGTHEVYVASGTSTGGVAGDAVVIGAQSASGKCYWLQDVAGNPGTKWSTSTSCTAVLAPNDATFTPGLDSAP
jgi:type IV pilus assembly protein PilA